MRQNIAFYKHGCSGIEDLTGRNFTDALFQKALLLILATEQENYYILFPFPFFLFFLPFFRN